MLRDPSLVPLSHQHQHGLALCVLTRRSLAADPSAENRGRLARRIRDGYDLELANHFQLEETILFVEARARLGPVGLIDTLIEEHRRMESMVAGLGETPSGEALEEFCALLEAHIRREEKELFQDLQQRLPRETLDRIGAVLAERAVRICL